MNRALAVVDAPETQLIGVKPFCSTIKRDMKRPELTQDYFIKNLEAPAVAWPTLVLLTACYATHIVVGYLYYTAVISCYTAVLVNFVSAFVVFTPMHDAAHKSILSEASRVRWANDLVGYLSSYLFPAPFPAFKHMHLQHHKHTNDPEHDPDFWVATGPPVLFPLRWMSIEIKYYSKYLPMIFKGTRPTYEIACVLIQLACMIVPVVLAYRHGFGETVMVVWIIPGRLSLAALAYCFDYLPHRPHKIQRSQNPAAATCVTSLYGNVTWLLTWPLLHQNYHAIHHFAPHIPFYHYSAVWTELKEELIKKGVAVNPIIGPSTPIMMTTKVD